MITNMRDKLKVAEKKVKAAKTSKQRKAAIKDLKKTLGIGRRR